MAKKDKEGNWLDEKGRPVPEKYIPVSDKKRDKMVESILKKAQALSNKIAEFKACVIEDVDKYLSDLAKDSKVKENWKGNILLYNFDHSQVIDRRMDDTIGFDEKLQMVKTIIDKWINEKMQGADPALVKVITQAFNVDKKGKVNTALLLKLLKLDIQDAEWKKAMKLLKESITVTNTKQTISFRRKYKSDEGEDAVETICLNFNDITAGK